jgi:uncharacterized membrane protein
LEKYAQIDPKLVDRIFEMAESQGKHRQKLETLAVSESIRLAARGQVFGLIIGVLGIGAATTCAIFGHGIVGGAIAVIDVVALASLFIRRDKTPKQPAPTLVLTPPPSDPTP